MESLYGLVGNKYDIAADIVNPASHVDAVVLAAGVAKEVTVPTGAAIVNFSSTDDIYVKFGGTAAIPVADVTDGSASILNPATRLIHNVASIGLISPSACVVTLEFYG